MATNREQQIVKEETHRMTSEVAINSLREAKSTHLEWLAYVQALSAGIGHEQIKAPLSYAHCKFGHWFYQGAGNRLSATSLPVKHHRKKINILRSYVPASRLLS